MAEDRIILTVEDTGEEIEFYVIEETKINNIHYLLVTDASGNEDGDAYILKDTSDEHDEYALYEFVEDERELEYVAGLFGEVLDDIIDIER